MNPKALSEQQLNALNELVNRSTLRQVPIDLIKASRFINRAEEALKELPTIRTKSIRHSIAYDCAHDVAEALLAAYGFATTTGVGQHASLGEVLIILCSETNGQGVAELFDQVRRDRNQNRYKSFPVGQVQVDSAMNCANILLEEAKVILQTS